MFHLNISKSPIMRVSFNALSGQPLAVDARKQAVAFVVCAVVAWRLLRGTVVVVVEGHSGFKHGEPEGRGRQGMV